MRRFLYILGLLAALAFLYLSLFGFLHARPYLATKKGEKCKYGVEVVNVSLKKIVVEGIDVRIFDRFGQTFVMQSGAVILAPFDATTVEPDFVGGGCFPVTIAVSPGGVSPVFVTIDGEIR